ncbi:MAG TPA: GspE/PulE family protein [Nevskiaceae bacterium]|nr:GspE/PulE family protein [Nevskiaceae bacterium]
MNAPGPAPAPLLGQMLLARRRIGEADLERALAFQQQQGGRLGSILVRLGALSEESLLPVLVEQTGIPLAEAGQIPRETQEAALARLGDLEPAQLLALGLAVWIDGEARLCAAAVDPLLPDLREAVESRAEGPVVWHFIRSRDLERLLATLGGHEAADESASFREMAEDAPIISLVNSLIAQAIDEGASDIHIEPGELACEVRYRIDGVLHHRSDYAASRHAAVCSRIKLIANLDIAERRLPQDGRITLRASGAEMDTRVSVIPAAHGESVVMRLLPKQRQHHALERLGLEPDHLQLLRGWLGLSSGLVLVTGPTGSGKSTTLYSALTAVDDRSRKIITVEDPVEHKLPGLIQIQVQSEIGYSFARALRSILRHDPDVIMVGEIRDRETAEIAVQAALTGHLVLATLHTNDALSAFARLIDMGVDAYLVAAATQAVMAQRLVRRLCEACARPAAPPPGLVAAPADAWCETAGCAQCHHTGYRGRLGIYELVPVSEGLRHALASAASLDRLRALADAEGRRSLQQDGLLKARRGQTTLAEVGRVSADQASLDP